MKVVNWNKPLMIWRGQKASHTTKKENTALMNEYLFLCG